MKFSNNFFQFVRFCFVGTLNAVVDLTVYLSLTRILHLWENQLTYATMTAFIIANINSYFFNKFWTFKNSESKYHIQVPKFLLVTFMGLGINACFFHLLTYNFHLYDIYSKIIVAGIVLFWNFLLNKFWTFKPTIHAL